VALDNAVEETAACATGGVAAALAGSALLCHVEHAEKSDPFLHGSPVLLIMTDPLILPSRREHPQQSVDKDVNSNKELQQRNRK